MLSVDYPDLEDLTRGASFSLVISTLYYAHLLRYSTAEHLKELTKSVKIATKKKLQALVDRNYLVNNEGVFVSTDKTLNLLVNSGHKRKLLPPPATGRGAETYNSEALVKIIQQPFYKALLYPSFEYLIPDGLLVLQDGDRYQLNFLEIEAKKPKWAEYLEEKRAKYERLARDVKVFNYWNIYSQYLGLKCPAVEGFKFQVLCIGTKKGAWNGWRFEN